MLEKAANGDLNSAGFYLVPWRCNDENEEFIKGDCKATIRCYPFEHNQKPPKDGVKCFSQVIRPPTWQSSREIFDGISLRFDYDSSVTT